MYNFQINFFHQNHITLPKQKHPLDYQLVLVLDLHFTDSDIVDYCLIQGRLKLDLLLLVHRLKQL